MTPFLPVPPFPYFDGGKGFILKLQGFQNKTKYWYLPRALRQWFSNFKNFNSLQQVKTPQFPQFTCPILFYFAMGKGPGVKIGEKFKGNVHYLVYKYLSEYT